MEKEMKEGEAAVAKKQEAKTSPKKIAKKSTNKKKVRARKRKPERIWPKQQRLAKREQEKRLEERYADARKVIERTIIASDHRSKEEINLTEQYDLAANTLKGYVTLDSGHIKDILNLIDQISAYAEDTTRRRPLNIMMQAEPGSGKSHFIKCLAKAMDRLDIRHFTYNMSGIESLDDITRPLDEVRNIKVNDKLPLLFLDEFDSNSENYSLLLPLLWDGELQVGHRDLKVGRIVTILAGSGRNIEETMKRSKGMHGGVVEEEGKLTDLLSRINGGELTIPSLDEKTDKRNRQVDKVCIAIALLRSRYRESIEQVPWVLLHFIAHNKFRYGVRSITHLIDMLPPLPDGRSILRLSDLKFPFSSAKDLKESSLAYHIISDDGPAAVIDFWRGIKQIDLPVTIKKKPLKLPFFQQFLMDLKD